jgi:hypothetical protein
VERLLVSKAAYMLGDPIPIASQMSNTDVAEKPLYQKMSMAFSEAAS